MDLFFNFCFNIKSKNTEKPASIAAKYQVLSKPKALTSCSPALCPNIWAIDKEILYKAIYSQGIPFLALSIAKALENGNAIIRSEEHTSELQ